MIFMSERKRIPWLINLGAPLALLLVTAIGYAPIVHRLGFYWDDWPSIWLLNNWGAEGFRQGFASDRPLLAWVFMLTTPIFGQSAVAWQYFSIFTRWLSSLVWWWALSGLWPGNSRQVFWVALLFAIYPGFSQQYIAVTYSNAFLVFVLFIFSFGAMIWAHRKPAWFWPLMALSLLSAAFSMFITEYFFGLELLRPFILWHLMDAFETKRERSRQVSLHWLPYLGILFPFVIWRMLIAPSPRAEVLLFSDFAAAPLSTAFKLLRTILGDFLEVNLAAWVHDLNPAYLKDFDASVLTLLAGSVVAGAAIIFIFLTWLYRQNQVNKGQLSPSSWARQALSLGLVGFLVSGWAIWITDLHIELLFPYDRFTLITMMSTSLLIAGLIGLLDRNPIASTLILSVLVGFSVGIQFQHRLVYRQEWLSQKNFFWQLYWRAPGLQPGTVVLTSEIPFTYYSDNSLSAPLNWIYAPDDSSKEMPYLLYDIEARLGQGLPSIEPGLPVTIHYRAADFNGSTSQAIVLFYDPPRCLKVMNPALDRFLPVKPLYIREAARLSRLDLIRLDPTPESGPPLHLFGPEPPHNWCYYFEKAELHAQFGDWSKVAEMADRALKINKHFTEKNVSELIPFAMGYAYTGNWEKAVQLSQKAYEIWDKTQYPLCDAWQEIRRNTATDAAQQAALAQIRNSIGCRFSEP